MGPVTQRRVSASSVIPERVWERCRFGSSVTAFVPTMDMGCWTGLPHILVTIVTYSNEKPTSVDLIPNIQVSDKSTATSHPIRRMLEIRRLPQWDTGTSGQLPGYDESFLAPISTTTVYIHRVVSDEESMAESAFTASS